MTRLAPHPATGGLAVIEPERCVQVWTLEDLDAAGFVPKELAEKAEADRDFFDAERIKVVEELEQALERAEKAERERDEAKHPSAWRQNEPQAVDAGAPVAPSEPAEQGGLPKCEWYNDDPEAEGPDLHCSTGKPATFINCFLTPPAKVCEDHKCRCKQPPQPASEGEERCAHDNPRGDCKHCVDFVRVTTELSDCRASLQSTRRELEEAKKDNREWEALADSLQKKLREKEREVEEATRARDEHEGRAERYRRAVQAAEKGNERLSAESRVLNEKLATADVSFDERLTGLRVQLAQGLGLKEEQLPGIEASIAALAADAIASRKDLASLRKLEQAARNVVNTRGYLGNADAQGALEVVLSAILPPPQPEQAKCNGKCHWVGGYNEIDPDCPRHAPGAESRHGTGQTEQAKECTCSTGYDEETRLAVRIPTSDCPKHGTGRGE